METQDIFTKEQKIEIAKQYKILCCKELKKREHKDVDLSERDCYQRDYARVLYSPSFRRLQGKMQINGIKSDAFYRNRLTHSLEVAQIATGIASFISKICDGAVYKDDMSLLQAAALAHDIGHPAFGHKGERVLDEISQKYGMRFEGNAQNFRILRNLERKVPNAGGLNLTNRTLLAINKYLIEENPSAKKFMYSEDFKYLNEVRKKTHLDNARTLDVQIIEIADDIAYAVHDLEDGLSLRKFSIDEILFSLPKENGICEDFENIVNGVKKYSEKENRNEQDYSKIFRIKLTSKLTDMFVRDVTMNKISKDKAEEHGVDKDVYELGLDKYKDLLSELKKAVFKNSTRESSIQEYERRGKIVIKSLFNLYTDRNKNNEGMLLPPDFRQKKIVMKKNGQKRVLTI